MSAFFYLLLAVFSVANIFWARERARKNYFNCFGNAGELEDKEVKAREDKAHEKHLNTVYQAGYLLGAIQYTRHVNRQYDMLVKDKIKEAKCWAEDEIRYGRVTHVFPKDKE